jgi:hypothetical protein
LWVHDESRNLATVETSTGAVRIIGDLGVVLTDIAFDARGNLYGLSFTDFYQIDRRTAATTLIGPHGIPEGNSLVFAPEGTLFATGRRTTSLYTIDISTGGATSVGSTSRTAAGDLAFVGNRLFLSSVSNELIEIDLANNASGRVVGSFVHASDIWGLAAAHDNILYGAGGRFIYAIDTTTGEATLCSNLGNEEIGQAFGATSDVASDGTLPHVTAVSFNTNQVDPADLYKGTQPTSWTQQRSEIRDIVVTFDEPVMAVTAPTTFHPSFGRA